MPKLTITQGPDAGKEYDIDRAVILGRLDTNDIPVRDAKASREHAKIYQQGETFSIVDLNSSNGTYVNGDRITKRNLDSGDEISIGLVHMKFEDEAAVAKQQEKLQGRKSLDDVFTAAKDKGGASKGAGGGGTPELVMKGHQPIQYNRVKGGSPVLGFDFDQLSGTARLIVWIGLVLVFAAVIWISFALVAG